MMAGMIDERTVAQLEADGFTHIDATCAGCGTIVQYPFRLLRIRGKITDVTTVAELRRRCLQTLRWAQRIEVPTVEAGRRR